MAKINEDISCQVRYKKDNIETNKLIATCCIILSCIPCILTWTAFYTGYWQAEGTTNYIFTHSYFYIKDNMIHDCYYNCQSQENMICYRSFVMYLKVASLFLITYMLVYGFA